MSASLFWKRMSLVCVLSLAAACDGIPIPIIIFATAGPSPTPAPVGPTATPPPAGIVTFAVQVPANTPAGSAPAVRVLDEVGGASLTVPLVPAGNNVWTGGTQAAIGAVLRYRYVRALPAYVEEVTPARQPRSLPIGSNGELRGQPVPYRLLLVNGENVLAEDIVAAWGDTPFAGEVGGLSGRVRNSNTGQGVMGIIVSAGGQTVLTAWDGSYTFFDVPAGRQRVTLLAPDGSLRPAQETAHVAGGQSASLDLASPDPNQVHITFVVRLPSGTDPNAVVRLAGNVAQMGNTFVLDAGGAAIAAARLPVLVPLADGRWTTILPLYAGTVLRYKYTLGDGVWNGELDSSGAARLRQLVVPPTDLIVQDTVDGWHSGGSASVTFEVTTPASTPANDAVVIQLRTDRWHAPIPMWRVGLNQWKLVLYNPTDYTGNMSYRYCRNYACGTADDAASAGRAATGRFFTFTLLPQRLRDNVTAWQWLSDASDSPPVALPPVSVRFGFAAGVTFPDTWDPNAWPSYAEALRGVQATGASWVTFGPRGRARLSPAPVYDGDLALSPHPSDWSALVALAHNAGLRVVLHPVTCAYTPYGACDYWNGAAYSPEFWNAWFAAYERHLLTQAEIAAQAAAEVLVVGDFKLRPSFPGEPEAAPDAEARWRSLIHNVRARYRGQLAFELLMGESVWPSPPPFLDAVDVIRFFWWSPLSAHHAPTASDLAEAAGGLMDAHLLPIQQQYQKGVHLNAAYFSADGAATQCLRRDDGQCHSFEDFNPGGPDVTRYPLDLQEQANIYSGLLIAVNARPWVTGFFAYGYNPMATLRDKSISVRGKPAEAVLATWYPRLQGR